MMEKIRSEQQLSRLPTDRGSEWKPGPEVRATQIGVRRKASQQILTWYEFESQQDPTEQVDFWTQIVRPLHVYGAKRGAISRKIRERPGFAFLAILWEDKSSLESFQASDSYTTIFWPALSRHSEPYTQTLSNYIYLDHWIQYLATGLGVFFSQIIKIYVKATVSDEECDHLQEYFGIHSQEELWYVDQEGDESPEHCPTLLQRQPTQNVFMDKTEIRNGCEVQVLMCSHYYSSPRAEFRFKASEVPRMRNCSFNFEPEEGDDDVWNGEMDVDKDVQEDAEGSAEVNAGANSEGNGSAAGDFDTSSPEQTQGQKLREQLRSPAVFGWTEFHCYFDEIHIYAPILPTRSIRKPQGQDES